MLVFLLAGSHVFAQKKPPVLQDSLKQSPPRQDSIKLGRLQQTLRLKPDSAAVPAFNQYEQHIRSSAELEIDGLVVDKTITKTGRDFYEIFQRQWQAPPGAKNFTITIEELPSRGNTSVVSLSVNDDKLFEQMLQPRYDVVEEIATYMVGVVYEHLLQDQLNKQLEEEGKKAYEVY